MSDAQHTVPHQGNLRVGRQVEEFGCYFLTKCTRQRSTHLSSVIAGEAFIEALEYQRSQRRISLLAFCLMPDHYHLLCVLRGEATLSGVVSSINKFMATRVNRDRGAHGQLWQQGYFDRRCRSVSDAEDLLSYIEHNPVRKDWAKAAADWSYSSAAPRFASLLDRQWFQNA
jgi:REP element-mobilizing transposase RayT